MGSSKSKEKKVCHEKEDQYYGYVEGFYNGNGYYGENDVMAGGIANCYTKIYTSLIFLLL